MQINPLVLFGRMTTLAQRQKDIVKAQFHYELTPEPLSLFKDSLMGKPTKSTLRTHLTRKKVTLKFLSKHVIDGGTLLYKVQWLRNSSYRDLANQY